jgi:hypothetical protein
MCFYGRTKLLNRATCNIEVFFNKKKKILKIIIDLVKIIQNKITTMY